MSGSELAVLTRAHQLFAASTGAVPLDAGPAPRIPELDSSSGLRRYRQEVVAQREILASAAQTDAATASVITAARHDHAHARQQTGDVVAQARADGAAAPDTPLALREVMRRRAARLRAQHAHVRSAQWRALQHRAALTGLRYRRVRHRNRLAGPHGRADAAVRAALSRLGRPYVWGATGPDQFDCSGLTQWAYAQAGVHLDRTTYAQINDGIPVLRSQIRPGDLVFPNAGHVQLAIGGDRVVEAPHSGAVVRISRLGSDVTIRRPLP